MHEICSKSILKTIDNYITFAHVNKKHTTRISETCQNQTVSTIRQCLIFVQSYLKRHESRG